MIFIHGLLIQDQFCEYMFQQATKNEWKVITENKSKFLAVSDFHKKGGLLIPYY